MTDNQQTFTEMMELIEEHKTDLPDYAYMKMMECMKKFHEAKAFTSHNELSHRNSILTKRMFGLFDAKKRCSNCGEINHTKNKCKVIRTIRVEGHTYQPLLLNVVKNMSGDVDFELIDVLTNIKVGYLIKNSVIIEDTGDVLVSTYDDEYTIVIHVVTLKTYGITHISTMVGMMR